MRTKLHEDLINRVTRLPADYDPFGTVKRWEDEGKNYPDCSMGCKYFKTLEGELGMDWGVCVNQNNYRFGLLTFEHQAGVNCFEKEA